VKFCSAPALEENLGGDGYAMFGSRFDPSRLSVECIVAAGVPLPAVIERSVRKRQAEFLAGRMCARAALEHLTGVPEVPGMGDDRAPRWPEGICGSITHNTHRAFALVASSSRFLSVGIDVETCLDASMLDGIANEILTESECERFLALPGVQLCKVLTLTFSIKESLYKALYPLTGVPFYFQDAELLAWSPAGKARLRLLCDLSARFHQGFEINGSFFESGGDLFSYVLVPP